MSKIDSKQLQDFNAAQFEKVPEGKLIWTPDNPFFWEVLHEALPPLNNEQRRKNERFFGPNPESGILEFIHVDEVSDYLFGGAVEEVDRKWDFSNGGF